MDDKPKTVSEIIEDVCAEICNHYCKYPDECDRKAALTGIWPRGC